jgi:Protein of unknown function (DUF3152)
MRCRAVGVLLLPVVLLLGGCFSEVSPHHLRVAARPSTGAVDPGGDADRARARLAPRAAETDITYPAAGPATWRVAQAHGTVAGHGGKLLRYHVAVENGITGVDPDDFARATAATLGDPRSWTAGGRWRLQLTAAAEPADFTIYLVTPATRDRLCADGYDRYTSCRHGDSVVLNVARWAHGVPGYGAGLDVYRQYMVNHETGHRLGHAHERCPAVGQPAPVMQQQTLGLHGCVANAWPYPNGTLYHGPLGSYPDPIPTQP